MDPDASPLVKAHALAAKGEQLTARRAYQQGLDAHTEAAKQFQIAAQATSDITAAKALLLQRDQQLKLVQEVQRKVDRGKDHAARSSAPTPQRYGPPGSPRSRETVTARQQSQPLHGANPIERLPGAAKYAAAGNVARQSSLTQSYAPRERVEASMMADSRYSRRSNSPSQSMMSTATPYHGSSAQGSGSSGVEESYYLLRSESDPSDPVQAFLSIVDNMVEELGNAVAFASAPLHQPLPDIAPRNGVDPSKSQLPLPRTDGHAVQESFYVIPSSGKAHGSADTSEHSAHTSDSLASSKTKEELLAENATLKATLDELSKRLDWLNKERLRDRDVLRGSVTMFARDVRRQAGRAIAQSTANLAEARRGPAMSMMPITPNGAAAPLPSIMPASEAAEKRITELEAELKSAKAEAEKQTGNAQRFKAKYEQLRGAILEKRKAKENAQAAAAKEEGAAGEQAPSAGKEGKQKRSESSIHESAGSKPR